MMDLRQLQEEVSIWVDHNFGSGYPHRPLLGIQEEVGELAHAHLKMEQGIQGDVDKHQAEKADAVGDILIYLADYCAQNDLDMGDCVTKAWGGVKKRDWIRFPETGLPPEQDEETKRRYQS